MNRKGEFRVQPTKVDIKYGCSNVQKLINKIMIGGKKVLASKIVYNALARLEKDFEDQKGSEILLTALDLIKPSVYLRSKRVASRVYHVPIPIDATRAMKRALLWLVKGARRKKFNTIEERLYREILDIVKEKKGESLRIREDYHRVAKENEAFIHYV